MAARGDDGNMATKRKEMRWGGEKKHLKWTIKVTRVPCRVAWESSLDCTVTIWIRLATQLSLLSSSSSFGEVHIFHHFPCATHLPSPLSLSHTHSHRAAYMDRFTCKTEWRIKSHIDIMAFSTLRYTFRKRKFFLLAAPQHKWCLCLSTPLSTFRYRHHHISFWPNLSFKHICRLIFNKFGTGKLGIEFWWMVDVVRGRGCVNLCHFAAVRPNEDGDNVDAVASVARRRRRRQRKIETKQNERTKKVYLCRGFAKSFLFIHFSCAAFKTRYQQGFI